METVELLPVLTTLDNWLVKEAPPSFELDLTEYFECPLPDLPLLDGSLPDLPNLEAPTVANDAPDNIFDIRPREGTAKRERLETVADEEEEEEESEEAPRKRKKTALKTNTKDVIATRRLLRERLHRTQLFFETRDPKHIEEKYWTKLMLYRFWDESIARFDELFGAELAQIAEFGEVVSRPE